MVQERNTRLFYKKPVYVKILLTQETNSVSLFFLRNLEKKFVCTLFSFLSGNYEKDVKLPSQLFCKTILMFLPSEEKIGVSIHPLPDSFSKKKLSFVLYPRIPQKKTLN